MLKKSYIVAVFIFPDLANGWVLKSSSYRHIRLPSALAAEKGTASKHDYVFTDPTAAWASDLDQLDKLEEQLAAESAATEHDAQLQELRRRHYESRKHMNQVQADAQLLEELAEQRRQHLADMRCRHNEARKHMARLGSNEIHANKKNVVYVDPESVWAADASLLEEMDETDRQEQLQKLRHRHHEADEGRRLLERLNGLLLGISKDW